jgi:glycosyltransferase involved in cell wall biosynthesis
MISVVIPFYNEAGNLWPLYRRLKPVLEEIAPNHEIIFVNDGSKDQSGEEANSIARQDLAVSIVHFRKNFGKANALTAGFKRVKGDLTMMMDADLQDQPEEAHKLIARLSEGFDLVTGWKRVRHDPIHKTAPSKLFNRTVSKAYGLDIHDFNCGFKVMITSVAKDIRLYGDFHRFIPVLASDLGYLVAECPVEHAPRTVGVSKYGGKRLVTGLLDFMATLVVTKFFHKPTQFFGGLALRLMFLGFVVGVGLLAFGSHLRPLWILSSTLVLGGLQILTIGLLGELVVSSLRRSNPVMETAAPIVVAASQLEHAVVEIPERSHRTNGKVAVGVRGQIELKG